MKKINWRYAIGELLIVIVGISIAFALNNWAGKIRDRDEGQAYLTNIKNDLSQDIVQLDSNIAKIELRRKYLKELMGHLHVKRPGRDTAALKIFKVADPVSFRGNETTIQSMKFSGDLKLITDIELKNKIIAHYSIYEHVGLENERQGTFAKDYLAEYFMKNIDYSKFRSEDGFDFVEEKYFQNLVYSLYGIYGLGLKVQEEARQSAKELYEVL